MDDSASTNALRSFWDPNRHPEPDLTSTIHYYCMPQTFLWVDKDTDTGLEPSAACSSATRAVACPAATSCRRRTVPARPRTAAAPAGHAPAAAWPSRSSPRTARWCIAGSAARGCGGRSTGRPAAAAAAVARRAAAQRQAARWRMCAVHRPQARLAPEAAGRSLRRRARGLASSPAAVPSPARTAS
jgi:hypothetical protein